MDTPPAIGAFMDRALSVLCDDARLIAVLAGGSWLDGSLDEWSDIDLVIVVADEAYDEVMGSREALAGRLGTLLSTFTGEHVGEPRLLVCLYDEPLLHVDLKFVRAADLADRVEDPVVLWDRDGRAAEALAAGHGRWPAPEPGLVRAAPVDVGPLRARQGRPGRAAGGDVRRPLTPPGYARNMPA